MTKTATDWIAWLEAEPRSEPDLSIAAVLREQAEEIERLRRITGEPRARRIVARHLDWCKWRSSGVCNCGARAQVESSQLNRGGSR